MATAISDSQRVRTRLAQLMDDTAQLQREPTVQDLREDLRSCWTDQPQRARTYAGNSCAG